MEGTSAPGRVFRSRLGGRHTLARELEAGSIATADRVLASAARELGLDVDWFGSGAGP